MDYAVRVMMINFNKVSAPVQPVWPTDDVADAIEKKLVNGNSITDVIPAMNMEGATYVDVFKNTSLGEFSVRIDFPSNDCLAAYEAIIGETYKFEETYQFDTHEYGAWISPSKQMAINLEYYDGTLLINVKDYYEDLLIKAPYIKYEHEGSWEFVALETDFNDDNYYSGFVSLSKDEEFVIRVANDDSDWRHFEQLNADKTTDKIV